MNTIQLCSLCFSAYTHIACMESPFKIDLAALPIHPKAHPLSDTQTQRSQTDIGASVYSHAASHAGSTLLKSCPDGQAAVSHSHAASLHGLKGNPTLCTASMQGLCASQSVLCARACQQHNVLADNLASMLSAQELAHSQVHSPAGRIFPPIRPVQVDGLACTCITWLASARSAMTYLH